MAKKVLFINQEIDPYVAESHMSIMGRELPQKMQEAGFEIRTFMPKWGTINERRGQLHEVIRLSGMNLIIDDTDHPLIIKVASIPTTRQQLYSEKAGSTMERLLQKPIEWVIAVKLERYYTKEEILALYLNYFDFLHNAVGIKTAANTYFNKEPKNLTLCESATLIGLCKNPSLFNPVRYPERARERRNVVLSQMVKAGYLSRSEYSQ